jgi:hypothetical protein
LTLLAGVALAQTPPDSAKAINIDSGSRPDQRTLLGERVHSAKGADVPNDNGKAIHLEWAAPPNDKSLIVSRSASPNGPFKAIDTVDASGGAYDDTKAPTGKPVYYSLTPIGPGGVGGPSTSFTLGPVTATAQWFNTQRVNIASFVILFFAFVLYFLWSSRGGRKLFVRRIAGIDAIEEAVGRATEMGRPVLYVPGVQDIDDIQTMAALVILESVARTAAQYETKMIVPTNYPVPFTLAQEMVKNGYIEAGRPEAYDPNSVRYITSEQFAYVAAINGIILRDRPAANLYLGPFFAESLLLAETGFATGAIQVAGTANVHQLPFLVVACDYTLIGEELYAASAYLSREPKLLSTLKGSDYMKVVIIFLLLLGGAIETTHVLRQPTSMSVQDSSFKQWFQTQ